MATIFEKIIRGEIPSDTVYRDERVVAFRDIRPAAPVHILVVPVKVVPTADDLDDEDESLVGHMVLVAKELARKEGIAKTGYRLIINCNEHGGQEVFHLHLHLIGGRPLGPMVVRT
jgi:histidine triad (HIT) family protein